MEYFSFGNNIFSVYKWDVYFHVLCKLRVSIITDFAHACDWDIMKQYYNICNNKPFLQQEPHYSASACSASSSVFSSASSISSEKKNQ